MIPHRKIPIAADLPLNEQWRRYFERLELTADAVTVRLPGGAMTFTGQPDGTVIQTWEPR